MAILEVARSNTEKEEMAKLIREYKTEHGQGPVNFSNVAVWALNNKKWEPPRRSLISDLKKRLSRSARNLHHTDPQGRRVRTMHSARYSRLTAGGQLVFEDMWDELEKMSEDHAQISFNQRWDNIANACKSLYRDNSSYADNNPNSQNRPVQLTFNFEFVLDEDEVPTIETIPAKG